MTSIERIRTINMLFIHTNFIFILFIHINFLKNQPKSIRSNLIGLSYKFDQTQLKLAYTPTYNRMMKDINALQKRSALKFPL